MDKPMLKLEKVSKFYSANGVVTADVAVTVSVSVWEESRLQVREAVTCLWSSDQV